MSTKPTNYPRSYVIERIEARQASIRSAVALREKNLEKAALKVTEETILWAQKRAGEILQAAKDRANDLYVFADRLNDTPRDEINSDMLQGETKSLGAPLTLKSAPANMPDNPYYGAPDYRSKATKAYHDALKLARSTEIDALQSELSDLDHALAYLRDTPVDEFSLTSLKQLGLLEVIKFRIAVPTKES